MKKQNLIRYASYTLAAASIIISVVMFKEVDNITFREVILGVICILGGGTVLLLGIAQDIGFWSMIDHNQNKQASEAKEDSVKEDSNN